MSTNKKILCSFYDTKTPYAPFPYSIAEYLAHHEYSIIKTDGEVLGTTKKILHHKNEIGLIITEANLPTHGMSEEFIKESSHDIASGFEMLMGLYTFKNLNVPSIIYTNHFSFLQKHIFNYYHGIFIEEGKGLNEDYPIVFLSDKHPRQEINEDERLLRTVRKLIK